MATGNNSSPLHESANQYIWDVVGESDQLSNPSRHTPPLVDNSIFDQELDVLPTISSSNVKKTIVRKGAKSKKTASTSIADDLTSSKSSNIAPLSQTSSFVPTLSSTLITPRQTGHSKNDGTRGDDKSEENARLVTKSKINFEEFYNLFYLNHSRSNKKDPYDFFEIYRECFVSDKQWDNVYTKTMLKN